MTDPVERELRAMLDERARGDPLAAGALADGIAGLPPRRRSRLGTALPVAAAFVFLAVVLAVALPRLAGPGAGPTPSGLPGGPDAFAGDPRLQQCGVPFVPLEEIEYVFVMTHARDYQRYMPRALKAPELDVDASAFVVIYREGYMPPFGISGGVGVRPTNEPGHRNLCVVVDAQAPTLYGALDITGLTTDVIPSSASPTPTALESQGPAPTPTPPPAPAWVADLAGQLECDGPVASIGSEVPDASGVGAAGATPDEALGSFLGPDNPFASLPAAGYTQIHVDDHWASYAHSYGGKTKAIIVLSDTNPFGQEPGWLVIGLRACDASEFDPSVPLTFPVTIWTDAGGEPASTETIRSSAGPGHCGWDAAIWLDVGGNLYFRDPSGVMKAWTSTVFELDAKLPAAAVDTGYSTGEWSLWLDPGGDAYMVSSVTIERWPRSTNPDLGCA